MRIVKEKPCQTVSGRVEREEEEAEGFCLLARTVVNTTT